MSKVKCDSCKKDFNIHLKEFEYPSHQFKGYVIETYFNCAHCQRKYLAYVTYKEIRKMQKEIKQFHEDISKINFYVLTEDEYVEAIEKHYVNLKGMKQELGKRMDELKVQVISKGGSQE